MTELLLSREGLFFFGTDDDDEAQPSFPFPSRLVKLTFKEDSTGQTTSRYCKIKVKPSQPSKVLSFFFFLETQSEAIEEERKEEGRTGATFLSYH